MTVSCFDREGALTQVEICRPNYKLDRVYRADGRVLNFAPDGVSLVSITDEQGNTSPYVSDLNTQSRED